jgi:glycogen(starch) synthase
VNVAIFASAFYPHVGGVEEVCRQLAHDYRRRGMGVVVVTNRWPGDLPAEETYEQIPVYRLTMRTPEGAARHRAKYLLTHPLVRRRMYGILRRHAVDLIHVQCVSVNGYYGLLAHRDLKLPLVVTAQGERTMDAGRLYERSAFMNGVLRALLSEADAVTACSGDTLADIERYFGTPLRGRGSVVYNGIQLADFDGPVPDRPHDRSFVLGIGRLVPQKGFDVLIRAYAEARLSEHDLVLAGEGPERGSLEAVARTAGVADRVRFFGRADRAAAVALFRHCDLFVLPSRLEPMGIVNLEAMAAGKPVIASRVGGVPELVLDGETGMLVPPEDLPALAMAIDRLACDPGLRARLGAAGRARAEGFDWAKIAVQYLTIYDALNSNRSG